MAKSFIDDLIAQAAKNAQASGDFQQFLRRRVDTQGLHLIEITENDIYRILVFNYVAIRKSKAVQREQKRLGPDSLKETAAENVVNAGKKSAVRLRGEAKTLASEIYNDFVSTYNSKVKAKAYKAIKRSQKIRILQPRNQADKVKEVIIDLLEGKAKKTLFRFIFADTNSGKQNKKDFSRRTQFLHEGRTVGTELINDLSKIKLSGNDKAKEAAFQVLLNVAKKINYSWDLDDDIDKRKIAVKGKIGQIFDNEPGSDSNDWKQIKKKLEKLIAEDLSTRGLSFASGESSQPFDERLANNLLNKQLIDPLVKKGAKGTKLKVETPKKRKSNIKKPRKTTHPKAGNLAVGQRKALSSKTATVEKRPSGLDLLQLVGLLNQKLPDAIVNNMGSPALNYQTGRFANSVRVTDIIKTPRGFPSIGYTYQTSPYQTFEPGYAQGSAERDPRRLIDRSIREVAVEFALGRFYTRRV
jgi:hypothetical protein